MSDKSRLERIRETLLHAERGAFTGGGRRLKQRPTVNRGNSSGSRINTTRVAEIVDNLNDVRTKLLEDISTMSPIEQINLLRALLEMRDELRRDS